MLRPLVVDEEIKNPYWLAGFTSGDGTFYIDINKDKKKLGETARLVFKIYQHSKDEKLMRSLVNFFSCGRYVPRSTKDFGEFIISKFSDINGKVIPFFDKYKIVGIKFEDYQDWTKVAELMKNKAHLTSEGLDQIRNIKVGMNKRRNSI